jgi:phosphatidylserine decarboxylase
VRPIEGKDDPHIVVSPADCRVVVFNKVPSDQLIWIKSRQYNTNKLLDMEPGHENDIYRQHELGPKCQQAFQDRDVQMGMFRLAPQDYHRYHSPVTGKVILGFEAGTKLHSVSADAITSENLAILNKRYVIFIEPTGWPARAGGAPALLAYVIIGAICVGSINLQGPEDVSECALDIEPFEESNSPDFLNGCLFNKGDCTGTFKFGGSTIAMVFQENALIWDQDLVFTSYFPVENVINMGNSIGTVNPNPDPTD